MHTKDEVFRVLAKKNIYQFLQGDGPMLVSFQGKEYGLPYLTGTVLANRCVDFGIIENVAGSRWNYVEALLSFAIEKNRCDELLKLWFALENFDNLKNDIDSMDDIESVHIKIIESAIQYINNEIRLSHSELIFTNNKFYIVQTGQSIVIESPQLNRKGIPYIQGLKDRCKDDFLSGNYDSVITKSRTMIEEILVQILEDHQVDVPTRGDLNRLYNQVKQLYGMQQNAGYDGRVNSLLGGLERIVQSIAEMRNANSDAHGVGSRRISIRECEAQLVMNSAITFCEYIISDHRRQNPSEE